MRNRSDYNHYMIMLMRGECPFVMQSAEMTDFAEAALEQAENEFHDRHRGRHLDDNDNDSIPDIPRSPIDSILEDVFIEIVTLLESQEGNETAINMIKDRFKVEV